MKSIKKTPSNFGKATMALANLHTHLHAHMHTHIWSVLIVFNNPEYSKSAAILSSMKIDYYMYLYFVQLEVHVHWKNFLR